MAYPAELKGQRLFFALWPEPALAETLAAQVPARVPVQYRVTPAELHITLLFLGRLSEAQCADAMDVAAGVYVPSFDLQLDHLGQFARAQVVWLGPRHIPEPLHQLANSLRAGLEGMLPLRDVEEYNPHITLARRSFLVPPPRDCDPQLWKVREFALVASAPDVSHGSRYTIMQRWPLVG